jgi:hypothetical protein
VEAADCGRVLGMEEEAVGIILEDLRLLVRLYQ